MVTNSRIAELAADDLRNTSAVNEHLIASGLAQPSFELDGPTNLKMKSADAENARVTAIGAALELQDLLQGPVACIRPTATGTSLEVIYR
ncbi:hypothetical protein N7G274_001681 [Stereocaulon virgatum]|uniref:Uncharacterized protein n=1 Tax=Stereocaulon virgatum TaxID=373712 RepID=A0ABR4ANH3_9LECA